LAGWSITSIVWEMRTFARRSSLSPIVILVGEVMKVEASFRTDCGQVAVNIRVWRVGEGIARIMRFISSSKPVRWGDD